MRIRRNPSQKRSTICTVTAIDKWAQKTIIAHMQKSRDAVSVNQELARRYDRWLLAQGYIVRTRKQYNAAVTSFLKCLGNRLVTKTTQAEIQEYLATCAASGWAAYKIRGHLYSLRIFFDFLCLGGLMPWSPPRLIYMKRLRRQLPRVLTVAEVKKLVRAARCPRERMLVEVFYGTGLRSGELLSLKIKDIDFAHRRFLVRGKMGERMVMFSQRVGKVLKQYLAGRRSGFVFGFRNIAKLPSVERTKTGGWRCRYFQHDSSGHRLRFRDLSISRSRHLTYAEARRELLATAERERYARPVGERQLGLTCLNRDLNLLGARCGLEVNPRILRHTFATHVLDNGADIRALKDFMGHTSLRTTTVYTNISKIPLRRAYDAYHPEPS
jgi:site-specific recombinase XerD